jgi:hypothetical protein
MFEESQPIPHTHIPPYPAPNLTPYPTPFGGVRVQIQRQRVQRAV